MSEKIKTSDVNVGGGLPKTIAPGEQVLKINDVRLLRFPFMEEKQGYYLILDVETKPIAEFEGFLIDKDDESKGRYDGQIGMIKTNRFYYTDGQTKSGIVINRDTEILKQIKILCITGDFLSWFEKADGKYDTIEEFVAAFSKAAPYRGKFFKFCVAGKEFTRENGYIGYDLFLPKLDRGKVSYEPENTKVSKLMKFDETKHITKADSKEVSEFGEEHGEGLPAVDDISSKGPEFEL